MVAFSYHLGYQHGVRTAERAPTSKQNAKLKMFVGESNHDPINRPTPPVQIDGAFNPNAVTSAELDRPGPQRPRPAADDQ